MKFLLDESTETRVGTFLKDIGHSVTRIGKDYPASLPDNEVLEIPVSEGRILITNDRDFGNLIFKKKHPHKGVIYFRFPLDSNALQKIVALKKLLSKHSKDLDKYLTISPKGIRIKT